MTLEDMIIQAEWAQALARQAASEVLQREHGSQEERQADTEYTLSDMIRDELQEHIRYFNGPEPSFLVKLAQEGLDKLDTDKIAREILNS